MTLLSQITHGRLAREKVQLTLSGHGHKKRVKDIIGVHGLLDNDLAREMGLNVVNYDNMNENEVPFHHYEVPTIQCDTINVTSYINYESRITFFFVPHPNSTNNEMFFYYKYPKDVTILLYEYGPIYSVVLKV